MVRVSGNSASLTNWDNHWGSFFTFKISHEQSSFHIGMDHCHRQESFTRSTMRPIVTFLAPSFWMNLPSRVIHKPKYGLLESQGPNMSRCATPPLGF